MPGLSSRQMTLPANNGSGNERTPVSRIVVIGAVAFLLQVIIAPNIAIAGIAPNFMLVGLIPVAAIASQRACVLTGFVYGLLFDLLGAGPVGAMALVMAAAGYLLPGLLANIRIDGIASWAIVSSIVYLAVNLVFGIVLAILGYEEAFFAAIVFKVIPWTVYDIVIGLIAWPFVRRVLGVGGGPRPLDTKLQV